MPERRYLFLKIGEKQTIAGLILSIPYKEYFKDKDVIIYGFMYTIIQLQDYALLMGSIGLFIVLAIVMYLSRKIDWYSLEFDR